MYKLTSHRFHIHWFGLLLIIVQACVNKPVVPFDPLEQNLIWAGKNRSELEKVIAHYQQKPEDSLKLKSTIFLLSNMENNKHYSGDWMDEFNPIFLQTSGLNDQGIKNLKDSFESTITSQRSDIGDNNELMHITSDYLIDNIDQAVESWQHAPWAREVSFSTFCNYILPYKSGNETPENWRTKLKNRYQYILDDPHVPHTMEDIICALVNDQKTWFRYTEEFFSYPGPLSISNILTGQRGSCGDMASLAAYCGRAFGIPVAIEFTPQWANHSEGHIWNALITSDSCFLPFLGAEAVPGDYAAITRGETKLAKAYRHIMAYHQVSFAAQAKGYGITDIPGHLKNARILDVTSNYQNTATITLNIKGKNKSPVYLCMFYKGDWKAIDGGFIQDDHVLFNHMGRDILYMPMFYKRDKYQPAAPPFILDLEGDMNDVVSKAASAESLNVLRKYPIKKMRTKWAFAEYMIRSRFEGSDSPDFKNPVLLYTAPEPMKWYQTDNINGPQIRDRLQYETLWEKADIHNPNSYRYVRMIADTGIPFKLGEMRFYTGEDSIPLTGKAIGSIPDPDRAFDGLPGYSIIKEDETEKDRWVGLDLGRNISISKIHYLPANDKNQIAPEKTYELFYWKDKWVSLGVQKSKAHYLEYNQVPGKALYWIHCKDCNSSEERPFTYENNRQVWW